MSCSDERAVHVLRLAVRDSKTVPLKISQPDAHKSLFIADSGSVEALIGGSSAPGLFSSQCNCNLKMCNVLSQIPVRLAVCFRQQHPVVHFNCLATQLQWSGVTKILI